MAAHTAARTIAHHEADGARVGFVGSRREQKTPIAVKGDGQGAVRPCAHDPEDRDGADGNERAPAIDEGRQPIGHIKPEAATARDVRESRVGDQQRQAIEDAGQASQHSGGLVGNQPQRRRAGRHRDQRPDRRITQACAFRSDRSSSRSASPCRGAEENWSGMLLQHSGGLLPEPRPSGNAASRTATVRQPANAANKPSTACCSSTANDSEARDDSPIASSITGSSAMTRRTNSRRTGCVSENRRGAGQRDRGNERRCLSAKSANSVASRRGAAPKSVPASTMPAHTMPIQISLTRVIGEHEDLAIRAAGRAELIAGDDRRGEARQRRRVGSEVAQQRGNQRAGRAPQRQTEEKTDAVLRERTQSARQSPPRPPPCRSCGTIPCAATRQDAAGTPGPRTCRPNMRCRARARTRRREQDRRRPTAAIRIRAWGRPPAPPSTRHRSASSRKGDSRSTNVGFRHCLSLRVDRGSRRRRGSVRRSQCGRQHRASA